MKKLIPVLIGLLIFSFGVGALSAELSLSTDIQGIQTLRGTVPYEPPKLDQKIEFLAEFPLKKKKWGSQTTASWAMSGLNFGVKGPVASPFYGIIQFNFDRANNYSFSEFEIGGGVKTPFLIGTELGAEVSFTNPSLVNIGDYKPNLTAWIGMDFALFPNAPPEG